MRHELSALLAAAKELDELGTPKQIRCSLCKVLQVLSPLLREHGIVEKVVVPKQERDHYDSMLNKRLVAQAAKTCNTSGPYLIVELARFYELFVEMMEQYCISTRNLEVEAEHQRAAN